MLCIHLTDKAKKVMGKAAATAADQILTFEAPSSGLV